MSLLELENESVRREILGILEKDPDYSLNDGILLKALELRNYRIGSDRLRTQLHWLAEQGLVTMETLARNTLSAKLTQRGEDVALGRSRIPGVARQRPE